MKKKKPARIRTTRRSDVAVIGWREWVSVPTLGIDHIKAKIDTGARTSSIHAFDVEPFIERGAPHVSFSVCPAQHSRRPSIECAAEIVDRRMVTSSSGHRELRFVIQVDVGLGGLVWPIELTLTDRDAMGFRMLLGREAVRRQFLTDPNRSYIAGRSFANISTVSNVSTTKGRKK